MKDKKENKLLKVVAGTTLVAAIGVAMLSGTYAKYTSAAAGTDTARVAKWTFEVEGTDIAKSETFTKNLFDTITNTDGTAETAVKETDGSLIAPGTMGKFNLAIENKSEVTASYTVAYEVTFSDGKTIPLEFTNDVDEAGKVKADATWHTDISEVNQAATEVTYGATATSKTVYWRWAFEDTTDDNAKQTRDISDTGLATTGTDVTATLKATVTATQKD